LNQQQPAAHRPSLLGILILGCRLVVGVVFLYASLNKIADPFGFADAVYNYRVLPIVLLHPFALLLPWVEAVAGFSLLLGLYRRGAALLAALMALAFTIAVSAALARGLDISCGCFHTDGGAAVGRDLLVRDFFLLAACVFLLFAPIGAGRARTGPAA
jgi:uncharacterized membrane protein YphA (DoxX/SURF4 family)